MGFKINPYYRCVANKMINIYQCTITWYVDGVKISHKSEEFLTDIDKKVENEFGALSISRYKSHIFLGMNFTLYDNGTLSINMREYIQ